METRKVLSEFLVFTKKLLALRTSLSMAPVKKYIRDIPVSCRQDLCRMLDVSSLWVTLGKYEKQACIIRIVIVVCFVFEERARQL